LSLSKTTARGSSLSVVEPVETTARRPLEPPVVEPVETTVHNDSQPWLRCPHVQTHDPSVPYTYILRCADGSYYAGSTFNIDLRVAQHNSDRDGAVYTRSRRPVELVWAAWFDSMVEAFAFEKRIQGWSRSKREALIEGRMGDLPELARSRSSPDLRKPR
jgi:putative endonuclease